MSADALTCAIARHEKVRESTLLTSGPPASAFQETRNVLRTLRQQMKRNVPAFGSGWKGQGAKRSRPSPVQRIAKRQQDRLKKPELKNFDTAVSFNFDATSEVPATGQLCLITTGDTVNDRDGAVIQVKSLALRGLVEFVPAAAATAATHAYIFIVQDRQANGAAAANSDVLTNSNLSSAMHNVPNEYRFKVLKKIVVPLIASAGVTTAYNNVVAQVDAFIKFKTPVEIRYTASTGAVADIASNNLFLLAGSDGKSDDTITFNGRSRLRFTS